MTGFGGFEPHGDHDGDGAPGGRDGPGAGGSRGAWDGRGARGAGLRFRVVVVCSGDLCRSPLAAALLREGLPPGSAVEVTSAGTRAMVGSPSPQRLLRLAACRGVDLGDHAPRQLVREHLADTDLVLTATRDQRATVVGALPGALRRTFTLRELARLLRARPAPWSGYAAPAPAPAHALGARGATQLLAAPVLALVGSPGRRGSSEGPDHALVDHALADHAPAEREVARWSALAPTAAAGRSEVAGRGADDDLVDPYRRAGRAYRACLAQVEDAVAAIRDAVAG